MQDRPDLIQSELAGLAFDSLQQAFREKDISNMMTLEGNPPVLMEPIYMFIDPAAGGPHSDYCVLCITRFRGMVTVSAPSSWVQEFRYRSLTRLTKSDTVMASFSIHLGTVSSWRSTQNLLAFAGSILVKVLNTLVVCSSLLKHSLINFLSWGLTITSFIFISVFIKSIHSALCQSGPGFWLFSMMACTTESVLLLVILCSLSIMCSIIVCTSAVSPPYNT